MVSSKKRSTEVILRSCLTLLAAACLKRTVKQLALEISTRKRVTTEVWQKNALKAGPGGHLLNLLVCCEYCDIGE